MAIAVTFLGGFMSKSAGTDAAAVAVTAGANIGDLIVVLGAADNAGASGASSITTVDDARGNAYSLVKAQNRTAGSAANDGCSVAIFQSVLTTALVTNDTINLRFSPNTVCVGLMVYRVTGANTTSYSTDGAGGSGTTYTSNVSASMASGDLYIGAVVNESGTAPGADSDTTNGSWSGTTVVSGGAGGDATKLAMRSAVKVVTGSGTQTFNGATGASTDWALAAALYTVFVAGKALPFPSARIRPNLMRAY